MFNDLTWREGEKKTLEYMKNNGYKIIYTNYFCNGVELDIVATLSVSEQKKKLKIDLSNSLKNEKNKNFHKVLKKSYSGMVKNLKELLIITEVKARSSEKFGKGADAITEYKVHNIKKCTEFLLRDEKFKNMQVRFDVSSVDAGIVNYIENAF